jgi:hypothetical protein
MHAKLFVELGVEVGSGLALISTSAEQQPHGIVVHHCESIKLALIAGQPL